jgi:hypothetical protein
MEMWHDMEEHCFDTALIGTQLGICDFKTAKGAVEKPKWI